MEKRTFKVVLKLGLYFVLLLALVGCQTTPSAPAEIKLTEENTFRFMLPDAPLELDPSASNESFSAPIVDHAFEPLVTLDKKGIVQPAGAAKWSVSEDGMTYTFNLREGAKWSDGKLIVASDYRKTWLRIMSPTLKLATSNLMAPYILNGIKYSRGEVNASEVGVSAPDDKTLIVKLQSPTTFFLQLVSYIVYAPIRTDIVEKNGEEWDQLSSNYISNGPYKVQSYEKGKSIVLVKNTFYWNYKAIKIPAIEMLIKQKDQDPFELYKSGQVDGLYQVLVSDLRTISDLDSQIYINQAISTAFISVNHNNPLFTQETFREALSTTIDRQSIVDEILLGGGIASRYLVPSSMLLSGENFHEFTKLNPPNDEKKSQKAFNAVDFSKIDKSKPIRVYYMSSRTDGPIMEAITQKWHATFGLNFELKGMEWPELYQACRDGNYDIALVGFGGDYPHPMTFLSMFLDGGFGENVTKWSDIDFQNKILQSLSIQDQKESLLKLRELEAKIIDENHIFPLYHRKVICLMNDRVKGWYRDGMLHFNFKEASLDPKQ